MYTFTGEVIHISEPIIYGKDSKQKLAVTIQEQTSKQRKAGITVNFLENTMMQITDVGGVQVGDTVEVVFTPSTYKAYDKDMYYSSNVAKSIKVTQSKSIHEDEALPF